MSIRRRTGAGRRPRAVANPPTATSTTGDMEKVECTLWAQRVKEFSVKGFFPDIGGLSFRFRDSGSLV